MQLSTRSVYVPFNAIRSPTWTFKVEAMTFLLSGTMALRRLPLDKIKKTSRGRVSRKQECVRDTGAIQRSTKTERESC